MLRLCLILLTLAAALPARAEGERAGDFDHYVLSLIWEPTWCALTGDARNIRNALPAPCPAPNSTPCANPLKFI